MPYRQECCMLEAAMIVLQDKDQLRKDKGRNSSSSKACRMLKQCTPLILQ